MFEVCPLIRPAIQDEDPHSEHAVWFLLEVSNLTGKRALRDPCLPRDV